MVEPFTLPLRNAAAKMTRARKPPAYVTCHTKKGAPRLAPEVCLRCRRMKACRDFQRFVQPGLFPEAEPEAGAPAPPLAPALKAMPSPATPSNQSAPDQLTFDF